MNAPHIRSNHGHEYNYLFKMTLERISWFVRDHYQREPGKDRTVAVTLSEQKMYPYSDMLSYMKRLRGGGHNCSVEWDFVDPSLAVTPHVDETPIHLADFAASALAMACEPKQHEMTDDRFQRNLSPVIYKRRAHGVTKHYGLKFFPGGVEAELQKQGRLDFLKLMG